MPEEILPNLYRIQIPLPGSPLKELNSYLITGKGRFLIIDTGLDREECKRKMLSELDQLNVDLAKTDFFITHSHADHLGLASKLVSKTSIVYLKQLDKTEVNIESTELENRWQPIISYLISNGLPEDELKQALEGHPAYRYGLKNSIDFRAVKEGDVIENGDYCFKCIETPGHHLSHMCLYEANKKILICGDHILFDISPNIISSPGINNSLKSYLTSLGKVYPLDVQVALPGHRSLMPNHRQRIEELFIHHERRLSEVLLALKYGSKTAFDVAPYVTWDINCNSWQEFPPTQKWFAVAETLAHLDYLEEKRIVQRELKGDFIFFSLVHGANIRSVSLQLNSTSID